MMRIRGIPFSVYGVPLIGLAGLLLCLWHPQYKMQAAASGSQMMFLADPSTHLDKIRTIFLRQEAKNVAYSRKHDSPSVQAKIAGNYNLVAQECTPAVFQSTHLPSLISP
ncbi:MAG: hypothetical protein ACRYFS_15875 [Janthinobacterium lividum]